MANYILIGNRWQNIGKLQLRRCCNTWKWCDGDCKKCSVPRRTYSTSSLPRQSIEVNNTMGKKNETTKYDWDITFCSNKECENINCSRNLNSDNAKSFPPYRPMYVADFTEKCKESDNNG